MNTSGSYTRAISLLCSTGLFLAGYVFFSSSLIESFYAIEFSLSSWQIGIAQSTIPFGAIIGAIFAGRLADKFGRHRLLVWNFLLITIIGSFGIFIFEFYSLCAVRFFNGFLAGTLYPLCAAYLTEMTPPHALPRKTAFLMFVNCLSAPMATVIAICLSRFCSDAWLWRMIAIFHVFPASIAYWWSKQLPESNAWLVCDKHISRSQQKIRWLDFTRGIMILFQKPYRHITISLMGAWFLMDVAYYGMNFFVPYLLQSMQIQSSSRLSLHALANNKIIWATLIINIFFMFGAMSAIYIVGKVELIKLQRYGFFCAGLSLFLLASYFYAGWHHNFLIILLFILFNFSINLGPDITTYLLSATSYPVEIRASGHGFQAGFAKFGSFLGVLFLPRLQDMWGYEIVILLLAGVLFTAYLFTVNFPKAKVTKDIALIEGEIAYEAN